MKANLGSRIKHHCIKTDAPPLTFYHIFDSRIILQSLIVSLTKASVQLYSSFFTMGIQIM